MNLVWHTLKKDLRLLWPNLLLCAAAALVAYTASRQLWTVHGDHSWFRPDPWLWFVPCWVLWISLFPAIVQADAPLGTMEFWMTRPIGPTKLFFGKLLEAIVLVVAPAASWHGLFLLSQGFHLGQAGLGVAQIMVPILVIAASSFGVATLTRSVWSFWTLLIAVWLGSYLIGLILQQIGITENTNSVSFEIGRARDFLKLTLISTGAITVAALHYRHRHRLFSAIAGSVLVCTVIVGIQFWRWPLPWLDRPEEKTETLNWNAVPVPGEHQVLQGDRRVFCASLRIDSPLGEVARFRSADGATGWSDGKAVKSESRFNVETYIGRFAAIHSLIGLDYRLSLEPQDEDGPVQLILGSRAEGDLRPSSYAGEIDGERVNFVKLGTTSLTKGRSLVRDGCKLMIDEIPNRENSWHFSVRYQSPGYKWNGLAPTDVPLLVLVNASRKEARWLQVDRSGSATESSLSWLAIRHATWTFDGNRPHRSDRVSLDEAWLAGAQLCAFVELEGPPVSLHLTFSMPDFEARRSALKSR